MPKVLLGVAGRVEHYSDFGSTTDGKVTARFELDRRAWRCEGRSRPASAPRRLGQSFFSATSTNFINGVPFENRTFPVTTGVAPGAGRDSA